MSISPESLAKTQPDQQNLIAAETKDDQKRLAAIDLATPIIDLREQINNHQSADPGADKSKLQKLELQLFNLYHPGDLSPIIRQIEFYLIKPTPGGDKRWLLLIANPESHTSDGGNQGIDLLPEGVNFYHNSEIPFGDISYPLRAE